MNGCPNSCARIQVADIGLKGQLVLDADGNQVEGFQVHLGGGLGLDAGFGRKLRGHKVTADELPDYVERVVRRFADERRTGERFAQWVGPRRRGGTAMSDARSRPLLLPVLRRGGPPPARGHARRLALPFLHPRLHPQARRTGDVMSADTLISPMPDVRAGRRTWLEHREALARRAAWRLEDASPQTIIRWAVRTFGSRFAITSSMADAVLIDLVAQAAPGTDVVFLDTGYHFDETLTMRDAVAATYRGRINLVTVSPEQTVAEQDAEHGRDLFASNPDRCCFLRKVLPLDRALAGYDAWGSGLRRDDSIARSTDPGRRLGPAQRHGQGQPVGPLDPGRRRRVHRAARDPHQPAAVGRLRLGRLLPVHPPDRCRRGRPGRSLGGQGQERVRDPPGRDAGMTAPSYPLVLGLAGRRAVVVGGGPVAARRTTALVEAGADVLLVAPWVCEDLRDLVRRRAPSPGCRATTPAATWTAPGWCTPRPATRPPTTWWPRTPREPGSGACAPTTRRSSAAWTPAVARAGDVTVAVTAGGDPRRATTLRDAVALRPGHRATCRCAATGRRAGLASPWWVAARATRS